MEVAISDTTKSCYLFPTLVANSIPHIGQPCCCCCSCLPPTKMCAAGFLLSFSGCIAAKEKAAHIVGYVCCMTTHCVERVIGSFVRVFLVKKKFSLFVASSSSPTKDSEAVKSWWCLQWIEIYEGIMS